MQATDEEVTGVLREAFGIADYRGPQAEAIDAVLAGRDLLITMPTGAGKSLVYQLPAVVLPGMTLVVSPLIALMKDQVDALRRKGVRASFVNSSIDGRERARRLRLAEAGELDLLYVTPERFRSPAFLECLPRLNIDRLAVDEAHCISQWGHDFRPDYSLLGEYRRLLGDPPTVALTATATPRVADDIQSALRLSDPLRIRTGIERENLFLAAQRVDTAEEKLEALATRLAGLDGAGIVYSALIRDLEALHSELRRRGLNTFVYHGGLSPEERRRMQDRFMSSDADVVLATNAFGMGVDKPDIRFVLHAQIPRTLEAWAQEVGRAGRDGEPSLCELFYFEEDIAIQQGFIDWANPDLEYLMGVYETLRSWGERVALKDLDDLRAELLVKNRRDNRVGISLKWLEVLGVTEGSFEKHDLRVTRDFTANELPEFVGSGDKKRGDLTGLLNMVRFATDTETCRRVLLARHFELEEPNEPCGTCDVCADLTSFVQTGFRGRVLTPPRQSEPTGAPASRPAETDREGRAGENPEREQAQSADQDERDPGSSETTAEDAGDERFQRGDWVRVDGRHIGQVLRVDGSGSRVRLLVESASDMRRRTVNPRRSRVEKIES